MSKNTILEVKDLSFKFGEKNILSNISFSILENDYVALVGGNGSGKTTLSKILAGLLKPNKGEIILNNTKINKPEDLIGKVGIVFQNPDNQFIGETPELDIAFGLEIRNVERELIKSKVNNYLEKFNLTSFYKDSVHTLSGGQKQKTALVSQIILDYKVLIIDESLAMINEKDKKHLKHFINSLINHGITIIHISQDLNDLENANKYVLLSKHESKTFNKEELPLHSDELYRNNVSLTFDLDLDREVKLWK